MENNMELEEAKQYLRLANRETDPIRQKSLMNLYYANLAKVKWPTKEQTMNSMYGEYNGGFGSCYGETTKGMVIGGTFGGAGGHSLGTVSGTII